MTPNEKYILTHYCDTPAKTIAKQLKISEEAVRHIVQKLRKQGHDISNKRGSDRYLPDAEMREVIKGLQKAYAKHGKGDHFNHAIGRAREKHGFKTSLDFCNAVRSYMSGRRIDGTYSDMISGKIPGHKYIGFNACDLLSVKKWNSEYLRLA